MKKKQVTLLELAKRLNLSPSTVSRALNDRHRISEETRKRVKALAAELEYMPNPSAKSLRESRTYTIGVILPEIARSFFSIAVSGMEDTLIEAGYNLIICQSHESADREKAVAGALLGSRVDGVLISLSAHTKDLIHLRQLLRKDISVVFFDRVSTELQASCIVVNDFEGSRVATTHLIEQGCKKIAHIAGPEGLSNSLDRLNGFREAMKMAGMEPEPHHIRHCRLSTGHAEKVAHELLSGDDPPDGIFAFNDRIGFEAIKAAKSLNLEIPKDLAMVGFGDMPLSLIVDPELSTVMQPAYQLGKLAAEMMLNELETKEEEREYSTIVLPTELVVRASSRRK